MRVVMAFSVSLPLFALALALSFIRSRALPRFLSSSFFLASMICDRKRFPLDIFLILLYLLGKSIISGFCSTFPRWIHTICQLPSKNTSEWKMNWFQFNIFAFHSTFLSFLIKSKRCYPAIQPLSSAHTTHIKKANKIRAKLNGNTTKCKNYCWIFMEVYGPFWPF